MAGVTRFGKWRIKPSGKLPIYIRSMINSSFTKENTNKAGIQTVLRNRTYLHHMMYWEATEYDPFESEIISHLKKNDGWFEKFCERELRKSESLYQKGLELKKVDWRSKDNKEIKRIWEDLLVNYRALACPWYTQYPLDEYFEKEIENHLKKYLSANDSAFRNYVLIFSDPQDQTEVSEEREKLVKIAARLIEEKEDLANLSQSAEKTINDHLDRFAYINRGLATSRPYSFEDMVKRLKEIFVQVKAGASLKELEYQSSAKKIARDFKEAINKIKPDKGFRRIIDQARLNSYFRNRRVEAFFNADYGASFMYEEIAKRFKLSPDLIMEITTDEMEDALNGKPLPDEEEMARRGKDYAMVVKNSKTTLITDPDKIKELEKEYFVDVDKKVEVIIGRVASIGGVVTGRAKVCLDKSEIGKVEKGDIIVAQFTTPDFVPAMEKAAAIVADQGGLSSHAAIISRELGVPCIIGTKNGTRIILDYDLLEVDTIKGEVRILRRND